MIIFRIYNKRPPFTYERIYIPGVPRERFPDLATLPDGVVLGRGLSAADVQDWYRAKSIRQADERSPDLDSEQLRPVRAMAIEHADELCETHLQVLASRFSGDVN